MLLAQPARSSIKERTLPKQMEVSIVGGEGSVSTLPKLDNVRDINNVVPFIR